MTRTHSPDELTTDDRRQIRLRALLDRRFLLLVGLFIAIVVAGGWLAYEPHVAPATIEDSQPTGTWEEQPTLSHQAEIQRANPVFPVGETLRNQGLYYTRLSPELQGTYTYAYEAPDGELDTTVDVFLVLQSVDDDGNVYWSERERLERDSIEGLQPGQEMQLSFDLNVSDVEPRIEAIESGLGASPGTSEATVVVETTVSGTVNGERISNRHVGEYVLEPTGSTYSVQTNTENVGERTFTETVEIDERYGPLRSYGSLALVVFGLVGIATLGYGRHADLLAVTDDERRLLEAASQREEFDDWISVGRVEEADLEGPRIEIANLEGLVDVAIDSDRRVIEDPQQGAYYVVEGDVYHVYEPADRTPEDDNEIDEDEREAAVGGEQRNEAADSLESKQASRIKMSDGVTDDVSENERRAAASDDVDEGVGDGVLVGGDPPLFDDAGDRPFFENRDSEDSDNSTRDEAAFDELSSIFDDQEAEDYGDERRLEDNLNSNGETDPGVEAVDASDEEPEEND
ncbi:DUF5305 domain-containing protein [Natronosalvus amylolyticus]|uniref:DUF5305 domain-containing protein n=1 Tax=Natronosalvus amylolyticus TaxID=2961994 RepID=UPI0020C9A38B|nr:DUF5305 domain-containing protein [Natronosalvus amylolyticus]